ncbi:MAG: signal recognition particle protein, partial [Candidatus Gastranaerophilales bacterium]|nr:signal recognition particle protein [Candidatus Gastranaerophilales bacterium]
MMFDSLSQKLQEIIAKTRNQAQLTDENMQDALREIRRALLGADVSLNVVKSFISSIKDKATGAEVIKSTNPSQTLIKIVNDELVELLGKEQAPLKLDTNPSIIMMLGLQGSGKTTSAAKLALKLKKEGKKPLLVALDVYRPAAILQLKTLANDNNIDFFSLDDEKDVVKIARKSLEYAKENNDTVLIFDTAGRLQIDSDMMAELMLINHSFNINEKLLVVDSMIGQSAIDVALNFNEQLGIDGVILTKLDGDTKGGCALSIVQSTGKPIKLIATGENIIPLEEFHPDRMANRIVGMGDIVTLVERAQKNIDIEEAKALENKMLKDEFSFEDFLKIKKQMNALGSFGGILSMLPLGIKKDDADKISHEGEKQFKKIEVFIQSMTPEERKNPNLLNASRKRRIAAGAGMDINELNQFISQFEMMRKMMKGLGGLKQQMKGKKGQMPFN